jgi:glycosyltransferase involved in cell wall biosynthesis
MKILQIEDEPWDSGIAHYALAVSAELARRGHEVHVWGKAGAPPLAQAAALGLPTRAVERPWVSLGSLRQASAGFDLINAHTGSGHSLAAALAALRRQAVVRTRGDARPPSRHALTRALAGRTRAFVAANSLIAQRLREAFPGSVIRVILQGIDDLPPPPLPDSPVFGLLGRLDQVKGHEDFITAAQDLIKSHPKARFLAAGGDPNGRLTSLKRRESPVEFLGYVENAAEFRSRCSVGVVASTGSEAVSRAALEWLASGRPVVSTKVGGLPDLVDEAETGFLVPPANPHALAAAMKRFILEPGLAARLGAQARSAYESRFTLRRFGDETEALYQDVLDDLAR